MPRGNPGPGPENSVSLLIQSNDVSPAQALDPRLDLFQISHDEPEELFGINES